MSDPFLFVTLLVHEMGGQIGAFRVSLQNLNHVASTENTRGQEQTAQACQCFSGLNDQRGSKPQARLDNALPPPGFKANPDCLAVMSLEAVRANDCLISCTQP